MSAEVLRRAAALMRERAESATPGPWEEYGVMSEDGAERWNSIGVERDLEAEIARLPHSPDGSCDTAHIASWHPAVALAVADWLEVVARRWVEAGTRSSITRERASALAVARAYLGAGA